MLRLLSDSRITSGLWINARRYLRYAFARNSFTRKYERTALHPTIPAILNQVVSAGKALLLTFGLNLCCFADIFWPIASRFTSIHPIIWDIWAPRQYNAQWTNQRDSSSEFMNTLVVEQRLPIFTRIWFCHEPVNGSSKTMRLILEKRRIYKHCLSVAGRISLTGVTGNQDEFLSHPFSGLSSGGEIDGCDGVQANVTPIATPLLKSSFNLKAVMSWTGGRVQALFSESSVY